MSGNQHPSVTDAPVETSAACPSGQAPVFEPVKGERSLLLHICCGPCSIMPVKRLQDEGFTVTAWYMNPNIQPLMEYLRRREAAVEADALLIVANYNTPAQFVVSGHRDAVALACQKAKEHRGRAIELKVSGAFHSPMMEKASRELEPLLRKAVWRKPQFPVYCNLHGRAVTDGESAKESLLKQMTSSVLWIETVRNQYADGVRRWVEVGPKAVLGKMVPACLNHLDEAARQELRVELVNSLESVENFSA